MTDIEKYADKAMFAAAPMASTSPTAHLLWMTNDPLGACAAAVRMYKGQPTYSLDDIGDAERRDYFEQVGKTELKAPLEFIKFHFMIEGVDRAFTHQLVRQRTAVYAQESLRFAVKEDLRGSVSVPPSLNDPSRSHSIRNDLEDAYYAAVDQIQRSYEFLIANGVPAEDARALLPQSTLTRINYATDLRNLSAEAGKRLCTQAQFAWREAFLSIRESIATHEGSLYWDADDAKYKNPQWQYEIIADSQYFSPVCYQIGRCGFKAEFDRACNIRERVDANEAIGRPSSEWDRAIITGPTGDDGISAIDTAEWMQDPKAAWVK